MITKPIDQLTIEDIEALITNKVGESRYIEYKSELPGNTDSEKKEFLADVSSFANTAGGHLLYGLSEADGIATEIIGLNDFNRDTDIPRFEQLIQSGLEPRIPGLRLESLGADQVVLAIQVPRSWAGPHRVALGKSSRFFGRSTTGKFPMDITDIRNAFLLSADLPERIRRWRDERIARIKGAVDDSRLSGSPKLVVHVVPLGSFGNQLGISAKDIWEKRNSFRPLGGTAGSARINVDGVLSFVHAGGNLNEIVDRCQVFRSGCVEAIWADLCSERNGAKLVGSIVYERYVIASLAAYLKELEVLGVSPPISVMLTLMDAQGAGMEVDRYRYKESGHPIDRAVVAIPDILIDNMNANIGKELRPAFDAIWNACGWPQSINYDDNGEWRAHA